MLAIFLGIFIHFAFAIGFALLFAGIMAYVIIRMNRKQSDNLLL